MGDFDYVCLTRNALKPGLTVSDWILTRFPNADGWSQAVEQLIPKGINSVKVYTHARCSELAAVIVAAHHLCAVGFTEAAAIGVDNLEHGLIVDTEFYPRRQPTDACKSDSDLRREVESLLAQSSSKTGALDRPAWAGASGLTGADSTATVITGRTQLGPYKIEGPLGKGGMGEVCAIYDVGEVEIRPFLVMELLEGKTSPRVHQPEAPRHWDDHRFGHTDSRGAEDRTFGNSISCKRLMRPPGGRSRERGSVGLVNQGEGASVWSWPSLVVGQSNFSSCRGGGSY